MERFVTLQRYSVSSKLRCLRNYPSPMIAGRPVTRRVDHIYDPRIDFYSIRLGLMLSLREALSVLEVYLVLRGEEISRPTLDLIYSMRDRELHRIRSNAVSQHASDHLNSTTTISCQQSILSRVPISSLHNHGSLS